MPTFGTGAPGAGVPTFSEYYDTSTTPFTPYIYSGGAWHTFGGVGSGGNATTIQGIPVSATAPTGGQVLKYNGTNWAPAAAGGGVPTVVQVGGSGSGVAGVTLGAAPTSGNLLVGFCNGGNGGNAGTGYTLLPGANNQTWASIYYKIAGAGESATQTFSSNPTSNCGQVLFEISNGGPGMYWSAEGTNSTTFTFSQVRTATPGQLVLGAVGSENTTVPTSFSNVVGGGQGSFAGAHAVGYFYTFQTSVGPCPVVVNWPSSQWNDFTLITIVGA